MFEQAELVHRGRTRLGTYARRHRWQALRVFAHTGGPVPCRASPLGTQASRTAGALGVFRGLGVRGLAPALHFMPCVPSRIVASRAVPARLRSVLMPASAAAALCALRTVRPRCTNSACSNTFPPECLERIRKFDTFALGSCPRHNSNYFVLWQF